MTTGGVAELRPVRELLGVGLLLPNVVVAGIEPLPVIVVVGIEPLPVIVVVGIEPLPVIVGEGIELLPVIVGEGIELLPIAPVVGIVELFIMRLLVDGEVELAELPPHGALLAEDGVPDP